MGKEKDKVQESIKRIEEITQKLSEPDIGLEESVKLYEEGIELIQSASKEIEQARITVKKLTEDGTIVTLEEIEEDQ